MDKDISPTNRYDEFIVNNRKRVNYYLNMVLWIFAAAGPAIYAGVAMGIFHYIEHTTCIGIFAVIIAVSVTHLLIRKTFPNSLIASVFAITALDLLLVYMAYSHVSIYITWFLVPLLSLLFCDKRFYYYTSSLNYVLMIIDTWLTESYYA